MNEPTDDDDWQRQAKCRGLPPSLFIPDKPGGSLDTVMAVCWGLDDGPVCPVRAECERAGRENNELGVWGGVMLSSKMSASDKARTIDVANLKIQDARLKKV